MTRRWPLTLLLSGLLAVSTCWLTTGAAATDEDESGGKKPAATKPDEKKPAQPGKDEDESGGKKPAAKPAESKKPGQPGKQEDESGGKKPATAKPADSSKPGAEAEPMAKPAVEPPSEGPFNLAQEEGKEKNEDLKKFIGDFKKPHDAVFLRGEKRPERIEPLKKPFDAEKQANLRYVRLDDMNKEERAVDVNSIEEVRYYEPLALQAARDLLNRGLDKKAGGSGNPAVTRVQLLRAVEMVLAEVGKFAKTRPWGTLVRDLEAKLKAEKNADVRQAVERELKRVRQVVDAWTNTTREIERERLNARIGQVRAYADANNFDMADALGADLFAKYPALEDLHDALDKIYTGRAQAAIAQNDYPQARDVLDALQAKYRIKGTKDVNTLRKSLEDKTRDLYSQGMALKEKGQKGEALRLFEEGMRITPGFPNLRESWLELIKQFAVLRVGVRALPTQMSPTTAVTDVDRMATRLIFENLFRLKAGPSARDGYVCDIGADVRVSAKGIDVFLPPDLKWSDGNPVTAADIQRSYELLLDPRSPYYDVVAKELLDLQVADPQRFTLKVKRGYLDPVSLMCFPLVPAEKLPKDRHPRNQAFGKNPVGSGPYVFSRVEAETNEAVFTANPNYKRPDAPDGPAIKEIRFIKYTTFDEAKEAIVKGRWQMVLDLTSREAAQLGGIGGVAVHTPTEGDAVHPPYLNNPRVYFLAVNYRKPALTNPDVRRAIAAAIDREKILNSVFRGSGKAYHKALTGPFPAGSWVYEDKEHPMPPEKDLFNAGAAKGFAERGGKPTLSLRVPLDDRAAVSACGEIRQMLGDAGLQVNFIPTRRDDLVTEFAKDQPNFDLAYWYYDFDNETLSPWPLFDPNGTGERGRNFMGYERDNDLQGKLRNLLSHREFSEVQRTMQDVHRVIMDKMILVPLWQLDRHVAVHRSLQYRHLHPVYLFDDVEQWKLLYVEGQ